MTAAEHSLDHNAKAKRGLKQLVIRQVAVQVLTFAGGIVLARTLTPEIFGVFGIASFLVATLALLGDFGLGASLVQRKQELGPRDLQVAFTLQQALLTAVAIAIWIIAPHFLRLYPDYSGTEYVWLVRVLALTLFLQSWRSISVLQLERTLDFGWVARIEVVEVLAYQLLAVTLAVMGLGVWALVWATLARGVLGTALAFVVRPWPVRLAWDRATAGELLRFGVPFQLQSLANSAGAWVTPVLVGSWIGPAAVGLLGWASANGTKPLLLVGIVSRVAFPHLARVADRPEEVRRLVRRYLYPLLLAGGLWFSVIAAAGPELVEWIYGPKWLPAVGALTLYAATVLADTTAWVLGITLNARGDVRFVTRWVVVRTAANVVAAVTGVILFGFIGVPLASLLVGAGILVPFGSRLFRDDAALLARTVVVASLPCILGVLVTFWTGPTDSVAIRGVVLAVTGAFSFAFGAWAFAPAEERQALYLRLRRLRLRKHYRAGLPLGAPLPNGTASVATVNSDAGRRLAS